MICDLDAEKSVLSAIMLDRDAIVRASDLLTAAEFYSDKHRMIFDACLDLYQLGDPLDLVHVTGRLRQKGHLEKCGGASYVGDCAGFCPTSTQVRSHAKIVQQKAVQRRVNIWAHGLKERTDSGNIESLPELFGEMQRDVVELSDTIRERRSPHIADVLNELRGQWETFQEAKRSAADKPTGKYCDIPLFKPFNSESPLPYFMPGHLWMLAGYTSAGKSTALAQLLVDACAMGAKAVVFSLEEGRTTKAVKMLSNLTDIPQKYLLTGEINQSEMETIQTAEGILKSWGFMVYDDVRSLDEICLKAKKHAMQGGLDIVAVDYVQNIQNGGNSIYDDMRTVGPRLLDLAAELGVTVVALSQVTNESMRGDSEIIGLKGAGELAAAADIVLWLRRSKNDSYALDAEIRKNRAFGQTGLVPLAFSDRYTKITRRPYA